MTGKDKNSIRDRDIPLTVQESEAFGLEEAPDDIGLSWEEIARSRQGSTSNG
jgi:hypothetical protein